MHDAKDLGILLAKDALQQVRISDRSIETVA
jgi:hypothetical protein